MNRAEQSMKVEEEEEAARQRKDGGGGQPVSVQPSIRPQWRHGENGECASEMRGRGGQGGEFQT